MFKGKKKKKKKIPAMTCAEPQMQKDVRLASEQTGGLITLKLKWRASVCRT